jgi:glycosyltransferase involved in cell wall biosynthesis
MKKKSISFLLPDFCDGGVEKVTLNIITGLVERGYEIDLVLFKNEGEYISHLPRSVNVVSLNSSRSASSLPHLIKYLKRTQPDILISAKNHVNLLAIIAKKIANVKTKLVISVHGTTSEGLRGTKGKIIAQLMRIFYPSANAIITVSEGVAIDLAKVAKININTINIIYNPVVTADIYNKAKEESKELNNLPSPLLLSVGRLSYEKDFITLIKAFSMYRKENDGTLLIIGEGPERKNLEALIDKLNIKNDVLLPGFRSNPYKYMKNADLFVLSSLTEGLPTVIIESLACGTPVVSTDCPHGPREILMDGKYGKLVPVRNPEVLADAIKSSLISKPDQELLMERAQRFSFQQAIENYEKLILDINR